MIISSRQAACEVLDDLAGYYDNVMHEPMISNGIETARAKLIDVPTASVEPVVHCGECISSVDSKSVSCAYKCTNKISPCYGRTTYSDFGCLYGERKDEAE